ncbi:MAG: Holliday junction resolvase RuvX [Planctomycetota bacterium]
MNVDQDPAFDLSRKYREPANALFSGRAETGKGNRSDSTAGHYLKEGAPMIRWMGVDYGDKRIGLALIDDETKMATPWQSYTRRSPEVDGDYFRMICQAEGIKRIVVGLPVNADGSEGDKARAARRFGAWLKSVTGNELYFWDERYTTVEADALLANTKLPKKKKKARRDMLAAQIMLQDFFDSGCPKDAQPGPLDDVMAQGSRL